MPKLRDPVDSLKDIQRHATVFKSRWTKFDTNHDSHEITTKINEVIATIDFIINKLSKEEKSFSAKLISTELNLIKKEVKKNIPKINYHFAVPAMCNCTDLREAYKIGREHNMPQEEIDQVIRDAPPNTNLAKAHAALRARRKPQPIVIEPPAELEQDEDITNDSDNGEMDDDLKKLLGANQ